MPKDIEQSLANAYEADGTIEDAKVMDLLAEAMSPGESWAQSQHDGAPSADAPDGNPAPAATPAPAPAPTPAPPAPSPAPAPVAAAPAADGTAADPDAVPAGTTPVVLAKDGVHTIGYDKLVEAREQAATAKAEAARLAAELAEARRTPTPAPAAPAAAPAPAVDPDAPLFGDYTDGDLRKGVQTLLDQQATALRAEFEGKLKPVEVERQVAAQNAHLNTILTAHPDAISIAESQEFAAWKAKQPSFVRAAIEATQDKGSAAEMVDVLDSYRAAHPRQAAAPAPAAPAPAPAAPAAAPGSPAALAAKAIAEAKDRTPTTLSDIPAGTQAVVDEAAAMEQSSPMDLMEKLSSMTPDQIEAWTTRFV